MLTVIVSEKGGGSKNVNSEKTEINIGRVQGNDVVLPKGNVSKRHSRIVAKDGKVILVDLQSTNGTYVNGRKISSPIVITPRDKIYIGDFILQLSPSAGVDAKDSDKLEDQAPTPTPEKSKSPDPHVVDGLNVSSTPKSESKNLVDSAAGRPKRSRQKPTRPAETQDALSSKKSPLSKKAADSSPASRGRPPTGKVDVDGSSSKQKASGGHQPLVKPDVSKTVMGQPGFASIGTSAPGSASFSRPFSGRDNSSSANDDIYVRALRAIKSDIAQQVERFRSETGEVGDDLVWEKTENAVSNAVDRLKSSNRIAKGVDDKRLVRRALHEVLGWGVIGELLEDDTVEHVYVNRWDHVLVSRSSDKMGSNAPTVYDGCFSSEAALVSAISRMVDSQDLSHGDRVSFYRCRLPGDAIATIILPPMAHAGITAVVSRIPVSKYSLKDLRVEKRISQSAESGLKKAVSSKKRILVAAPSFSQQDCILRALLSEIDPAERLLTVEAITRSTPDSPNWLRLEASSWMTRGSIDDIDVVGIANAMKMQRLFVEARLKSTLLSICCVSGELKSGMLVAVEAPDSAGIFDYLATKFESDHLARMIATNFDSLIYISEKEQNKMEVKLFDIKVEGVGKPRLVPSSL